MARLTMASEPYLVTVIRQLADLEAAATLTMDETARLNQYRRWLGQHYPDVAMALAREYATMASRRPRPGHATVTTAGNEANPAAPVR